MTVVIQQGIPYTITDTEKVMEVLDLPFRPPHGMLIEKYGAKKSCVVKFVPPMTKLGMSVSDTCLEKLLQDELITLK